MLSPWLGCAFASHPGSRSLEAPGVGDGIWRSGRVAVPTRPIRRKDRTQNNRERWKRAPTGPPNAKRQTPQPETPNAEPSTRMQKLRYHEPGTAPATLIVPPEQVGQKPVIKLIEYDAHSIEEREVQNVEDVFECLDNKKVSWIDVSGLGDVEVLRKLGRHFRIHPLALEDVLTIGQRPKVDEYDDQLFILLQMAYNDETGRLVSEQVSVLLGKEYVITFQEIPGDDVFDPVRKRLREGCGNARFMRSDYLA